MSCGFSLSLKPEVYGKVSHGKSPRSYRPGSGYLKGCVRRSLDIFIQQADKAAVYTDDFHAIVHNGRFTDTAYRGVYSGTVATGGKDTYFHRFSGLSTHCTKIGNLSYLCMQFKQQEHGYSDKYNITTLPPQAKRDRKVCPGCRRHPTQTVEVPFVYRPKYRVGAKIRLQKYSRICRLL